MKNNQDFLSESFHFLVVKFLTYLNRHVFVMSVFEAYANSETPDNPSSPHRIYMLSTDYSRNCTWIILR